MSIVNYTPQQIQIISLAKEIANRLGTNSLSPADFRANTNVTEYTIAREFGGWVELLRCAELQIPNRYAECSDDELLDEMGRVFETAGKRVNSTRFDGLAKYSAKMYRRRFGSWTEALARLDARSNSEKLCQPIAAHDEIPKTPKNIPASGKETIAITEDFAQSILRSAIDLLKEHPELFQAELAEIRTLVLELERHTAILESPSLQEDLVGIQTPHKTTSPLVEVAQWLANNDSINVAEFQAWLLHFDLLPSAAIDAINELALDICDEVAVEEVGDEILVKYKVINQVSHVLERR